jgi:hypothetical protein
VSRVAFDPTDSSRAFAYQIRSVFEDPMTVPFQFFVSSDGGVTFAPATLTSLDLFPSYLAPFPQHTFDVAPDGTIVAGALSGTVTSFSRTISQSKDHGGTFVQTWSDSDDTDPWHTQNGIYLLRDGSIALAGRYHGMLLYRSINQGMSFTAFGTNLPNMPLSTALDLASTPAGGILVGTQSGVFYAADGQTFAEIDTGFAAPPNTYSVAVLPGTPAIAFAGTDENGIVWRQLP